MAVEQANGASSLAAHNVFMRYAVFAAIAASTNLASQEMAVRILPDQPIVLSIAIGTGVGFFVKYALDKRWIFLDAYESHASEFAFGAARRQFRKDGLI
jgi:putative flippase GtrA